MYSNSALTLLGLLATCCRSEIVLILDYFSYGWCIYCWLYVKLPNEIVERWGSAHKLGPAAGNGLISLSSTRNCASLVLAFTWNLFGTKLYCLVKVAECWRHSFTTQLGWIPMSHRQKRPPYLEIVEYFWRECFS